MRHERIDPVLFIENRRRLVELLPPNSLAVVNANDLQPANGDATLMMHPNSDLFYLTGVEQEESILLLAPNAFDERLREVLFLREPNEHLKTWEGHKLSKEEATETSGITVSVATSATKPLPVTPAAPLDVNNMRNRRPKIFVSVRSTFIACARNIVASVR